MPRIEYRTVLAFGRDSHCVILPKSWLNFYGLKKGDRVEMITNDESIVRVPQPIMMAGVSS